MSKNVLYFWEEGKRTKPIIGDDLQPTGLFIDEYCRVYHDREATNPRKIYYDSKNRPYVSLNLHNGEGTRRYSATRIALMNFSCIHLPYDAYKGLEADHINPTKPLNNHISNLEFVDHNENMKRAGINRIMQQRYNDEIIHKICQMLCDGKSRKEIVAATGVNKNLIYDIKIGKTYTYISEQYLDKGFNYHKSDIQSRREKARQVCELFDKGYTPQQVNELFCWKNRPESEFSYDIHCGITYRYISKDYNFMKSKLNLNGN